MRRSRCWSALAVAVVILTSCGHPDDERFAAPVETPTVAVAADSPSSALPEPVTTESLGSEPSISAPDTASPTKSLGVTQVVPWGLITQDDIDRAVGMVASMTVAQKAGAVIMAGSGSAVGSRQVADLGLAGVNLLGTKGRLDGTGDGSPAEVVAVTDELESQVPAEQAGFPLLIGTDQEYGDVTRLSNGFTDLPGASELGSIDDLTTAIQRTQEAAAIAASEMAAVGINLDFAPVSDLLPVRGSSAIGDRSYGSDPDRVAALVTAAVAGYQSGGIAATLKHFPGIGQIAADSHLTLATVTADCAQWNENSAAPVRAGVDAGVSLVMVGHTLFPAVDSGPEPTSLSSIVISELLRGDPAVPAGGGCTPIGFRGVAISDSFVMAPIANDYSPGEAAWRALAAGQDIVLMPASPSAAVDGISGAVADGSLLESRLNEAAVRVFALRAALSRTPRPDLSTVGSAEHEAAAARIWNAIR